MSYDPNPNPYGPPSAYSPLPPRPEGQLGLILGIGSIVCGLLAFPLFICCCTMFLSPVFALGGIALGIGAVLAPNNGGPSRAFGWVGIVSGTLALLLFIGVLVFGAVSDTSTSPDTDPFDAIEMPSIDINGDVDINDDRNNGSTEETFFQEPPADSAESPPE
jgi:hypothetical protein